MRILIVNKFLYPNGGSETYIFKIGKQLQQMGHEVQYFGMEHEGRVVGNHAESYTSDMDFHGTGISRLLYPFRILYSWESRKKIRIVLEDFHPDVVHLNNINFQLTPSIIDEIRNFDSSIRIVYTAHDSQWVCPGHLLRVPATGELCTRCIDGAYRNCMKHRCIHNSRIKSILGMLEAEVYRSRNTYKKVDIIICPSEFMNRLLSHNKALRGRTVTLHNFADYSLKNLKLEKNTEQSYVLYFGRYGEEKGIFTLLEACRRLPEIPFIFAGKGPLQEQVNSVDNVTDKGFLSGIELQQLIRNATFTVFPSECYENCPFTVMESQINGTPILASDLGGTPELIQEGVTGETFKAGDVDQLEEKIWKLWNCPERCKEYRENCEALSFADGENGFDTLEEYCQKLEAIYG